MKLGAQSYSVRQFTQTYDDLDTTFAKIKQIGYDVVQVSGIGPISAEQVAELSKKHALPITCTHSSRDRILNDTDALIAEHKIFCCDEIGLGSIRYDDYITLEKARETIEQFKEPVKKIMDAGMTFAYHNHSKEFIDIGGTCFYDLLIEEFPEINFILDTYWVVYAGRDPVDYIKRISGKRIKNIHFKDMETEGQGRICACGNGIIDFKPIYDTCIKEGIPYAQVEEDNAQEAYGDAFEQMAISYKNLKPLFTK